MITIKHRKQIDLNLHQHEVLNLSHPHPGVAIECEQGVVWITSAGDIKDYTLGAGESYIALDSSSMVIQVVQNAVINVKDQGREFSVQVVG